MFSKHNNNDINTLKSWLIYNLILNCYFNINTMSWIEKDALCQKYFWKMYFFHCVYYIYIYLYIYIYIYVYLLQSRYNNNVWFFSKLLKAHFFVMQIFRSHFGSDTKFTKFWKTFKKLQSLVKRRKELKIVLWKLFCTELCFTCFA